MCVIFVAQGTRPTSAQVKQAFEQNRDGGGIAWREKDAKGDTWVNWEKGLDQEKLLTLAAKVPLPFILHCRISTCGGAIPPLTHPFPIAKNAPLMLRGRIKGSVMAHNGHWGRWKDTVLEAAVRHKLPVPDGPWSDTRAMAWIAANFGLNTLQMIDEKTACLSQAGEIELSGAGWCKISDGFWASNRAWARTVYQAVCRWQQCKVEKYKDTNYCEEHQDKDPKWRATTHTTLNLGPQRPILALPGSGGTSAAETFRPGVQAAGGGKAVEEEVEGGKKELGAAGTESRNQRPALPLGRRAGLVWTRPFSTTPPDVGDRAARASMARRGITRIGPM